MCVCVCVCVCARVQRATCLGPVGFAVWLWVQHFASMSLKGGKKPALCQGPEKRHVDLRPRRGKTKPHLFPSSLLDFKTTSCGAGGSVGFSPLPSTLSPLHPPSPSLASGMEPPPLPLLLLPAHPHSIPLGVSFIRWPQASWGLRLPGGSSPSPTQTGSRACSQSPTTPSTKAFQM